VFSVSTVMFPLHGLCLALNWSCPASRRPSLRSCRTPWRATPHCQCVTISHWLLQLCQRDCCWPILLLVHHNALAPPYSGPAFSFHLLRRPMQLLPLLPVAVPTPASCRTNSSSKATTAELWGDLQVGPLCSRWPDASIL
jgi:hypothetical protein